MGKTKQIKEKRFDRSVEISAPILDPEDIKAIHTHPKDKKLNLKHGGFKALLSDLNPQDSTDEVTPITENHLPSYIGISCAVSGYSNYSNYIRKPLEDVSAIKPSRNSRLTSTPNRSQTNSPNTTRLEKHQINHITIDRSNINSPDQERRELTEKLVASATEKRRSPSPLPPIEDGRHHGAYVGARYFPMPEPSKVVNKHIPLLGIDDDRDPDEIVPDDANKVEKKIANLYGDDFAEDWKESMSHKSKKEVIEEQPDGTPNKIPKDLVTLKPTPPKQLEEKVEVTNVATPAIKVLAGVEKDFLNKLLTDENPPMPKSPTPQPSRHESLKDSPTQSTTTSPIQDSTLLDQGSDSLLNLSHSADQTSEKPDLPNSDPQPSIDLVEPVTESSHLNQPISLDSPEFEMKNVTAEDSMVQNLQDDQKSPEQHEEHIQYEIRATSPVDNESSPVKVLEFNEPSIQDLEPNSAENLLSFSPNLEDLVPSTNDYQVSSTRETISADLIEPVGTYSQDPIGKPDGMNQLDGSVRSDVKDGRYFLRLLEEEESFITDKVKLAESRLNEHESELDEETIGKIRSAIGKANLLVNKKCNQFRGLCEKSLMNDANEQYAVLNDDLAGFWDMIHIQLSDVKKSFDNLS